MLVQPDRKYRAHAVSELLDAPVPAANNEMEETMLDRLVAETCEV